jgi:hypothetical protein
VWDLIGALIPYFFENIFFFISSVGSSKFKKNLQRLNQPTLVIFLTFFEKNYKDWIKCKIFKSRFKWTGLVAPTF